MFRDPVLDEYRHAINTKWSLHLDDFLLSHKGQFRRILSQSCSEVVIWSVEGFLDPALSSSKTGYVPKDTVSKARDLLKLVNAEVPECFETQVLVTIRNQVDMLGSAFCHTGGRGSKGGLHRHSFASFIRFCLDDTSVGFGPAYDFLRISRVYENLFGRDNTVVLPMEGLFDRSTVDYRKKLAHCLGSPPEAMDSLVATPAEKERSEPALKILTERFPGFARLLVSGAARLSRYSGIQSGAARVVDVATLNNAINKKIRDYYRTSNKELSATRDLALHAYEYW